MDKEKSNSSKKEDEKEKEEIIEEPEELEETEEEIDSNEFQEFLEPRKITAPVLKQIETFEEPPNLEQEVASASNSEEQDKENKEVYKIKSLKEDYNVSGPEIIENEQNIVVSPEFREITKLERPSQRVETKFFKGNSDIQELRKTNKSLEQDYIVNVKEPKEDKDNPFFDKVKKDYKINQ